MKVKRKGWLTAVGLVVVFLLLGVIIQSVLYINRDHESLQYAKNVKEALSAEITAKIHSGEDAGTDIEASLEENSDKKAERAEELSKLDILILVNPWTPLPEDFNIELAYVNDYAPELAAHNDNEQMEKHAAEALAEMVRDCRAAGNGAYICSAFRPHEKQVLLFENKVDRVIGEGYSPEEAPEIAAQAVAVPGTSEHELGLSTDILDESYPYLNEQQVQTGTQQWLMEHCWEYGYILRYPNGTSDVTGIIFEPWHYRYVGDDFAKEIHDSGLPLEQYLEARRGR